MCRLSLVLPSLVALSMLAACGEDSTGGRPAAPFPREPVAVARALPTNVFEGEVITLDGSASYDLDDDLASFAWGVASGPAAFIDSPTKPLTTVTAPSVNGAAFITFALTVTDAIGQTSTATVAVNVLDQNGSPTANAGAAQEVDAGAAVTLTGTAIDDGTVSTYRWMQTSGPAITISGAGTASPTFTAPDVIGPTTYGFTLTVTDNGGRTASATTTVHVRPVATRLAFLAASVPATAPILATLAPVDVEVQNASGKRIVAGDPAELLFTLGVTTGTGTLEGTLSRRANRGIVRFTDLSYDAVEDDVVITASTAGLASGDAMIDFTAAETYASAGPNQTVSALQLVTLDGSSSLAKTGAEPLTYLWTQLAGPVVAVLDSAMDTASFTTPDAVEPTVFAFQLEVSDGQGRVDQDLVSITVEPVAKRLAFAGGGAPTTGLRNATLAPTQVELQNASGARITGGSAATSLITLGATGGAGTLLGTTTRAAANGLALFDDVFYDRVATDLTLTATSALVGVDAASAPLAISWPAAWPMLLSPGTSLDVRSAVTTGDGSGPGLVLAGAFQGTLDLGAGPVVATNWDAFVAAYSPTGALLWARILAGTGDDAVTGVALGPQESVVLAVTLTDEVDFDGEGPRPAIETAGGTDVGVARLDLATGAPLWVTTVGGSEDDGAGAVAVDAFGNPVVTGSFKGTLAWGAGPGETTIVSLGNHDVFVVALDDQALLSGIGNARRWSGRVGTAEDDEARALVLLGANDAFIGGALDSSAVGFIARITGGTSSWVATLAEGGGFGIVNGLALADSTLVAVGGFEGTADFNPGSGTTSLASDGGSDGFVVELDLDGALESAARLGGPGDDELTHVATLADARVTHVVTGTFTGTADLDPSAAAANYSGSPGRTNAFVATLDPQGALVGARAWGQNGHDIAPTALAALDTADGLTVFVAGGGAAATGFDLDPTEREVFVAPGATSAFVVKLDGALWVTP